MNFINREAEFQFLNRQYRSKNSNLIIVYGRRRVGKTSLIEEFIKNKPAIYYLADLQTDVEQIDDFRKVMADYFHDSVLQSIPIHKWDQLFEYFTEKLKSAKRKTILVIDEFTYLHQSNKAITSIIQKYWDKHWCKGNKLCLILCGSFLGMMEQATLYYTSPIYGRSSGQIKLTPFNFKNFVKFCRDLPIVNQIELYSLVGGTPRYVLEFDKKMTILQNIEQKCFDPRGFLYNDPTLLLSQEFTKTNTYFSILKAIAEGNHKIGHVASKLEIKTNQLNTYFDKLIELNIVKREVPVTEGLPHKSKKGLYFINDNFFRFWFKFILPYKSYLEIGDKQKALLQVKKELPLLVSATFEDVCRELITSLKGIPFSFTHWGRWWDKHTEIDIVAINDNTGDILFGECKWQNKSVGLNVLKELTDKANSVVWRPKRKEYFAIFSRSGFDAELINYAQTRKNIFLYGLKEMNASC